MGKALTCPIFVVLLLTGCARDPVYLSDFCLYAQPIYPNGEAWDAADAQTLAAITAHNEKGVELGCWEAPKRSVGH